MKKKNRTIPIFTSGGVYMQRNVFKRGLIVVLSLMVIVFGNTIVNAVDQKSEVESKIKQAENKDNKSAPKWNKVGTLPDARSMNDYSWCGDSAIIYFHITSQMYDDFKGGIMLYDIKTQKRNWISKDSKTSVGFCNADGSVAYWYSKDGLMAYDVKSGRSWRTGIDVTKFNASICPSSTNNTILVVGVDRNQLASSLSNKLQGWRIIIRKDEYRSLTDPCGNKLAKDGNYVYYTGKRQCSIYDTDGKLQRVIDNIPVPVDDSNLLIISGDLYFLDRSNHLIKKVDIITGETTVYSVPEGTQGFDISSNGELVCRVQKKKGSNIWLANKFGEPPFLLEYEGSIPRFSPTGKYLYFHNWGGVIILEKE